MEHLANFKSTNVKSAAYDPQSRDLIVTFFDDSRYHYGHVSAEAWHGLQGAESKGKFIRHNIAKQHKGKRLDEE